ncbi:DmsE family decaheme c-type cytochrome [Bryobacter aggregatus]|uniref:DmsE family decaheme c-type cytochrome n=1 Tax=Bryobacter aggregatus TaxID=360054 RepID=UPI000690D41E|nr:DmsE family decaheme c-type cytochrome [Bryobacter aggregatus]
MFGQPAGYAGTPVCQACHPDISAGFFRNAHFKSQSDAKLKFEQKGCESCHGPGKAHAEARGDKAKIVAFSTLAPKAVLDQCLSCHAQQLGRANLRRSSHTTADIVCNRCHSIHKAATPKLLLAKPQTELCYSCHSNVRAQFSMPVKHRLNEGFMQCSDCHNPHGADTPTWKMAARPRMVAQGLQNEEPCLKCHTDKRGPFVFEHAVLRVDGCSSCHLPHGSMNARLLKRPQVFPMCLECHNGAGSFGRQADGIQLTPATHSLTDPKYQNCTACHTRIHGSNSNPSFLR